MTVPLLGLMLPWPLGASVHGLVLALDGDWSPALGTFGIGDQLFAGVTPNDDPPPPAA